MKILAILMMLIALQASPALATSNKRICPDPISLACLKKNFDALYEQDYKQCLDAYSRHQTRALQCKDLKYPADYLSLAPAIANNAEVSEDFGETLEAFVIKHTKCFLDAATYLNDDTMKGLIKEYVKGPSIEDERPIYRAMLKYRKDVKYRKIMQVYFSK